MWGISGNQTFYAEGESVCQKKRVQKLLFDYFYTKTFLAELQILFKLPLGQKIEKKIPSRQPFGPKFDFWPDSPGTAQIQFFLVFLLQAPLLQSRI